MLKKLLSMALICVTATSLMCSNSYAGPKNDSKGELKMFMNNPQHTGISENVQVPQFTEVKWKFMTGGRIYASPVLLDGVAYVGSNDKNFYAVDVNSGMELWRFRTGGAVNSTAAILDQRVFFASADGYFYALNRHSGDLIWKFKTNGEQMYDIWDYYLSSPAVLGDTVYFGSGDSHVYALDIRNGKLQWKYETKGIVHASPAIHNGRLFIGSFDGNMYALDAATGALCWKFKTFGEPEWFPVGEIQGSATVTNGMVYFGSRDYNMYALDENSGSRIWNYTEPSWVISTPSAKRILNEDMLFYGTSDYKRFIGISALTGNPDSRWVNKLSLNIFGGCTIAGNIGYVGSFGGKLYAINLETKQVLWSFDTDGRIANYSHVFKDDTHWSDEIYNCTTDEEIYNLVLGLGSVLSTPAVEDGVIYFGSTDGNLYAIK